MINEEKEIIPEVETMVQIEKHVRKVKRFVRSTWEREKSVSVERDKKEMRKNK